MNQSTFQKPSTIEQLFNRVFGLLVGLGLGLSHNYVLQVRGRKTGRMYSTPVNLLYVYGEVKFKFVSLIIHLCPKNYSPIIMYPPKTSAYILA